MSRTLKAINLSAFSIWIVLISLLLYRNYTGQPLERAHFVQAYIDESTYWYEIYADSERIGSSRINYKKVLDEIIVTDVRETKVIRNGRESILAETSRCVCDLEYSIKSFEYSSHIKGEEGLKATGTVDSDEILFLLESAGKRKTFRTPTGGKNFYLPATLVPALVGKLPSAGTAFLVPLMDFSDLSLKEMRVVLEEIRPLKIGTEIHSLYKFSAGTAAWWSNERGVLVKEAAPRGITRYSQMEKLARTATDKQLFDYTELPFIKASKPLNTEEITRLTVRIGGLKLDPELYSNSTVSVEGNVVTLRKRDTQDVKKKTYTLPYSEGGLDRYLAPDKWVSSDYKPLRDTGIIYARNAGGDAFLFTQYLTSYLYNLIKTRPMFTLQSGEELLTTLTGDYLERTIMFPSYARAAGLPTRLVGGLVYVNGYFYFHTWPEVWFSEWIPVDPTLFQFPADITHIPLREGTIRDIILLRDDLKSVTVEVLEAS